MNGLINISDYQVYVSMVNQAIEKCSQKERCALVLD